jgi:thiol-disulfide isomerase/thioredoxin
MMILLVSLANAARWWDFNREEFARLESKSLENPIYAICTASYCPHCRGLPELLKNYSISLGNSSNLVFTDIDSQQSDVCWRAKIRGVPTFVLIRGTSAKYWVLDYGRSPSEWSNFLQSQIGPTAREIHSSEERDWAISQSMEGGTSFHLILPKSASDLLQLYKKLSITHRIYGVSLTYEWVETIEKPHITAYLSPKCSITSDISADHLGKFMTMNRFSDLHHYDMTEWHGVRSNLPFGLCIVRENFQDSQKAAFLNFSAEKCNRMRFGWAAAKTDLNLFKSTKVAEDDAPFLYITGTGEQPCSVVSKRKIADWGHLPIFERVITGGDCSNSTQFARRDMTLTSGVKTYFSRFAVGSLVLGFAFLARPFVIGSDPKLE